MRTLLSNYDDERIASISCEIAEAIDSAAIGNVSWETVPRLLAAACPQSVPSINSQNFVTKKVLFQSVHNMDPEYEKSYAEHYAFINPWIPLWRQVESGRVLVSEQCSPARRLCKTEFYNDWLLPQRDLEAAVGIKIDGGSEQVVHMAIHYPLSKADVYDRVAAEIFVRVRGNLYRAAELGRMIRQQSENAIAGAAIVERRCHAAFVIDGNCHLRDANQAAVDLAADGLAMAIRCGFVRLAERRADCMFRTAVAKLSKGYPTEASRILITNSFGSWTASLAALPSSIGMHLGIFDLGSHPVSMILAIIRDADPHNRRNADFSALSQQFCLTPAEVLFCERLARGDSLVSAAGNLGIALDTARNRIKSIFRKTGTHRQGELMAMLAGFL